jgi:hypothetical protein
MAHFSDSTSGTIATQQVAGLDHGWIHDLVRGEMHPEADRLLQAAAGGADPQKQIEEATLHFLSELREQFVDYIRIFNGYSEAGVRFQEAKVYSIAQTAADFMIYRNQVKLLVTNASHGVIQLQFAQHQRAGQSAGAGAPSAPQAHELLAQMGPFGDVSWTYQGEKVRASQIARFYFGEFIRAIRSAHAQGTSRRFWTRSRLCFRSRGLTSKVLIEALEFSE